MKNSLLSGHTLSCGCIKNSISNKYEEISGGYWYNVKLNAKERNIEFNITIKYIWDLFLKQDRRCALSGERLIFVGNYRRNRKLQTASLDRIDSSCGYVEGNVQWVNKNINYMKMDLPEKEFIELCSKISNYNKGFLHEFTFPC